MIGPTLKGKKVTLKPIDIKEAANYLKWLKDKEVTRFLTTDGKNLDLKKERLFIKKSLLRINEYIWGIYAPDKRHIGSTGLHKLDAKNKTSTWGISIGEKNYWDQGLGTDALKTVIKFFFTKLKYNRLQLYVSPKNARARKCYTRCGFIEEGIKRKAKFKNGRFTDMVMMSFIKDDYQKLKNK